MLLLVLLFGSGWAFGYRAVFLPVLMSMVPFIWHINQQLHIFKSTSGGFRIPFDVYLALSIGLGAILVVVGLVWSYQHPLWVPCFPLLALVVYLGPYQYLRQTSSLAPTPLKDMFFFIILACFGILSYLLPMFLKLSPQPKPHSPSLGGG